MDRINGRGGGQDEGGEAVHRMEKRRAGGAQYGG